MLDRAAIVEVLHRYCRGVDRSDRDLIRSSYHPDAWDDHGIFAGLGWDFADFIIDFFSKIGLTGHSLSTCIIDIEGDVAYSETYCTTFHCDMRDEDGKLVDVYAAGRYLDRFERRNGEWRIAYRQVVVDWNQTFPAQMRGPLEDSFGARGVRGKADLSYQIKNFRALKK